MLQNLDLNIPVKRENSDRSCCPGLCISGLFSDNKQKGHQLGLRVCTNVENKWNTRRRKEGNKGRQHCFYIHDQCIPII